MIPAYTSAPALTAQITDMQLGVRDTERRDPMERNDPMTMSRLKAYRRNASAIEDIKAELSGKYVADSISVCTPPSYTPHRTRIDGFLPSGDTFSLLCEQARLEREQRTVEEFIKGIEDRQMRKIFVLRFVKGLTWIQIGHRVGGTADGCRMAVKRYLKK